MKERIVSVGSIGVVVLLILTSFPAVIGVQTATIHTEIDGANKIFSKNIQLSEKNATDIKTKLNDLESKLNTAKNQEEYIRIFNEGIIELNTLGVLPNDISVKEIQQLLAEKYQLAQSKFFTNTILHNNKFSSDYLYYFFCFLMIHTQGFVIDLSFDLIPEILLLYFVSFLDEVTPDIHLFYSPLFNLILHHYAHKPIRVLNYLLLESIFSGRSVDYNIVSFNGINKGTSELSNIFGFTGIRIVISTDQSGYPDDAYYYGFALLAPVKI